MQLSQYFEEQIKPNNSEQMLNTEEHTKRPGQFESPFLPEIQEKVKQG